MAEFSPNKDQKKAIEYTGSNVLVSAGAGSGKTTVLVERVIKKIIEDKASIDSFIIVTFTRAAASHMKEKIFGRIRKALKTFMADPAASIMIFCQGFLLLKARGLYSLGAVSPVSSISSSVPSSPSMAQNPPIGKSLMECRVSPLCFFQITGPIPKANSFTCTLHFLAAIKCPSS